MSPTLLIDTLRDFRVSLHPSAPAIAATLAGWAMFACLAIGARRYGTAAKFDTRFHKRIWRQLLASVVMGVVLYFAAMAGQTLLEMQTVRYAALTVLITLGMLIGSGWIGRRRSSRASD